MPSLAQGLVKVACSCGLQTSCDGFQPLGLDQGLLTRAASSALCLLVSSLVALRSARADQTEIVIAPAWRYATAARRWQDFL